MIRHRPRLVATTLAVSLLATGCLGGAPSTERGARLYDLNCRGCHGGETGGTVRDIPPPHNANGHTWHHADCLIKEIILDGFEDLLASEEAPRMPAFRDRLSEDEVGAILAYLKTWWTDQQRAFQREVTGLACLTPGP